MSKEEVEDIRNWFLLAGAYKCYAIKCYAIDIETLKDHVVSNSYNIYAFEHPRASHIKKRHVKIISVSSTGAITLYQRDYLYGYMNERKAGVSAEDTTLRLYTNELHEQLNWWTD